MESINRRIENEAVYAHTQETAWFYQHIPRSYSTARLRQKWLTESVRACRSMTIAGRSTKLCRHVAEGFYSSRLKKYIAKLKRYILNVIPKRINGLGLGAIGVWR